LSVSSILFVCTGNICRSPFAAGLFRARCGHLPDFWQVDSAGIHARPGLPPEPRVIALAAELGVDLGLARSRAFEGSDFTRHDNIVAMDRGHLDFLEAIRPHGFEGRIALLEDGRGNALEVPDPYGRPLRIYRKAAHLIATGIAALLEDLAAETGDRWLRR
jgi:protein-tyrosine phosphatase